MPEILAEQIVQAEQALARALLPFAIGTALVIVVLVGAGALWLCRDALRQPERRAAASRGAASQTRRLPV